MNKLSTEEKVRVVSCLVERNSLRATVRMTGIHRTTILRLLVDLGKASSEYQDKVFRGLTCKRVQCDMYYNFARVHQTLRVTPAMEAGVSDHVWTLEEIVGLL